MRRLLGALLGLLLLVQPALAFNTEQGGFSSSLCGGLPSAFGCSDLPVLSLNFLSGTLPSQVMFSRSSTATYFNSSGLLATASSGVPRFDYNPSTLALNGLLIEGQSTNLALQSRDLTQTVWTKSSGTAALDQTGIDGVSNSASSFTATAGNATVLQSITQASTSDTYSVYIKRITGTGEVDITLDGGTTWQNVTSSINSSGYTRVSKNQTVTNSSFGVRLVTSGDKVAIDANQIEAQSFASSYIPTTTATVTRAADVATVAAVSSQTGLMMAKFIPGQADVTNQHGVLSFTDSGGNNYIDFRTNNQTFNGTVGGVLSWGGSIGTTLPVNTVVALGVGWSPSLVTLYRNGSGVDTATPSHGVPSANNILQIGGLLDTSSYPLYGWVQQVKLWNRLPGNAGALVN